MTRLLNVTMTLTTPGCPMHDSMTAWAENALNSLNDGREVHVNLVWEPRWTPDKMTENAKQQLGF